jgi:hypothetical protein
LGKPKDLQVEEEKVITEYIVYVMVWIMSLSGTYIGGGMGCPVRSSQSKGTSSKLGERVFGGRMNLSYSEGGRLGMLVM